MFLAMYARVADDRYATLEIRKVVWRCEQTVMKEGSRERGRKLSYRMVVGARIFVDSRRARLQRNKHAR